MRDLPPSFSVRAFRKLKAIIMPSAANKYFMGMSPENSLRGITMRVVGDASADATEFFDHYDAFGFWASRKMFDSVKPKRNIPDVGSPKMMCSIFSSQRKVTSVVLQDCKDSLHDVRHVKHDVSFPLPFESNSFNTIKDGDYRVVFLHFVKIGKTI